ncbi:MAG: rhombosortase [Gammaproteobacteria bacterium]
MPKSSQRDWIPYVLPALLSVVAVALALGEDSVRAALRYDRTELVNGEYWRWLTGHIVHASWSHAWLNLAGLWVVWFLFKERLGIRFGWWITLVAILTMDIGFWFRDTQLGWYVGLSGLLHGYFTAGALDEAWRGVKGGVWLLLGVIAKLVYEQMFGALPMTAEASGGPVWVNSHLYGAMGGAVAAIIWNSRQPFTPGLSRR